MYAKITKQVSNAKNYHSEKETIDTRTVVVMSKGKFRTPVTARWYMGRSANASVVYCSVWISGEGVHTSGRGSAGGYGYHKASAAFQEALASAGIELYGDPYDKDKKSTRPASVFGVGDSAINDALLAVTRALGYRGQAIVV